MWGRIANLVERVLGVLDRHNRLRLYFATWLVLAFHTRVIWQTHVEHTWLQLRDPIDIALILLSYATVIAVAQLANLVTRRHRVLQTVTNAVVIAVYALLVAYHHRTGQSLEYDLIRDNFREIFYPESLNLFWSSLVPTYVAIAAAGLVVGLALELRFRVVTRWSPPAHPRRYAMVMGGVLVGALLFPMYSYDVGMFFLQTAVRSLGPLDGSADRTTLQRYGIDLQAPYPLLKRARTVPTGDHGPRPNVIVVEMESFNGLYVNQNTPDGRPITPTFNALARRGFFIPYFHGNSIQTAKGQMSVLCSVMPTIRGKIYRDHPRLSVQCLPDVLKQAGYTTMFFSGAPNVSFDSTGAFMRRHGFDVVQPMDREMVSDAERPLVWNWGLQDDVFYRKVFGYVDRDQARHAEKPYFLFLATISHHMPFEGMPAGQRQLYPQPATYQERFADSLNAADRYLAQFFVELDRRGYLKDTIVIVVGDHSFPSDEHGSHFNQVGFYEENFRTPFVLLWPEHVSPSVREDMGCTQLDIAPTVMELLGLNVDHNFFGRSVLQPDPPEQPRVAHLVQPYDGKYVSVIADPYKYVVHLRTHRELLFNLREDPHEDHNLMDRLRDSDVVRRLRTELDVIFVSQRLVDQDRIWPRPAAKGRATVMAP